ncbi:hypothetical protein RRG08_006832 [Elysia crispata]|uniref:Uncharacterized protein n=1 Tax=Elysia crispata TaxID=231223 RepID=A0AAE1CN91_9GAST|nr:hypothetical protein RRG08_006832 [Elysia crispata]
MHNRTPAKVKSSRPARAEVWSILRCRGLSSQRERLGLEGHSPTAGDLVMREKDKADCRTTLLDVSALHH